MLCGHFEWFCHKVLPAVYDESLSYYEVVCKLYDMVRGLGGDQSHLVDMINALDTSFEELKSEFTEITSQWADYKLSMDQQFSQLEAGIKEELTNMTTDLENYIKAQTADISQTVETNMQAYINENLQEFVARIVKFVVFGLTKDGHLAAYIPDTWDFLEFTTPQDPESQFYGHLVLKY